MESDTNIDVKKVLVVEDDQMLRDLLASALEAEGIEVVPPTVFLGDVIARAGVCTQRAPTDEEWRDIKYGYRVAKENPPHAEVWFEKATQHEGSWWLDWAKWLKRYGGGQVAARKPGSRDYPSLEDAPGSFVKKTLKDTR